MPRAHLLELQDQLWWPRSIRDAMTDCARFVVRRSRPYAAVAPPLRGALERTGDRRIVDLCSGAGGPWLELLAEVDRGSPGGLVVVLTDLHPDHAAFAWMERASGGRVRGEPEPVSAAAVPARLAGFRTMFSAFHHFDPVAARRVLADAVAHGRGIAVFEGTERSIRGLAMALLAPLLVLVFTPAIWPFRWARLLWTYLIPIVPLAALWDALVSCLRSYTVRELEALAAEVDGAYDWEVSSLPIAGSPLRVTCLIGVPRPVRPAA